MAHSKKPKLVTNKKVVKLYRGNPTVKNILKQVLANSANIKQVVIVTKDADGFMGTGWSNSLMYSEALGLCDWAKSEIMDKWKGH